MTYREHSYDPYAYEQPGQPLRPFNWVQWVGVVFEVAGVSAFLIHIAGRIGWIPEIVGSTGVFVILSLIGVALINSRREPSTLVGSEQLRRNRKVPLITVAVCAVIIGAAVIFEFTGA